MNFVQWTEQLISVCLRLNFFIRLEPSLFSAIRAFGPSEQHSYPNPLSTRQYRAVLARLLTICSKETSGETGVYHADCTIMIDGAQQRCLHICVENTLQRQIALLNPGSLKIHESMNNLTDRFFATIKLPDKNASAMAAFTRTYAAEFKTLLNQGLPGVNPFVAFLTEIPDQMQLDPVNGFDDLSEIDDFRTFLKLLRDDIYGNVMSTGDGPFQPSLTDSDCLKWSSKQGIKRVIVMPIRSEFCGMRETVGFLLLLTRHTCSKSVDAMLHELLHQLGNSLEKALAAIQAKERLSSS